LIQQIRKYQVGASQYGPRAYGSLDTLYLKCFLWTCLHYLQNYS